MAGAFPVEPRYFSGQRIEELAPEIEALLADAEKTAPQLADVYVVRGGFRVAMRQREEAMRDMRHALELGPNTVSAASALGYYHLTSGEPREALTYYTMASTLDPRDYGTHVYRCMGLTDLGQYAEAEVACSKARALDPGSPWVYSVASAMEASRGNFEAALKWSDAALERGQDVAAIQGDRARWLVALGLPADAGKVYEHALAANPKGTRENITLTFAGASAASNPVARRASSCSSATMDSPTATSRGCCSRWPAPRSWSVMQRARATVSIARWRPPSSAPRTSPAPGRRAMDGPIYS